MISAFKYVMQATDAYLSKMNLRTFDIFLSMDTRLETYDQKQAVLFTQAGQD